MAVIILHLSDIHIKSPTDAVLSRGAKIAASIFSKIPTASHIFIVVSGDIAFSGKPSEYDLASKLLSDIKTAIQAETSISLDFIFVPGNHDCDFTKDSAARKVLIKSMEDSGVLEIDDSIIKACTEVQHSFFEFRDKFENASSVTGDLLWRSHRFEVESKTIVFDCLNVSWTSKIREEPSRLYFPINRYVDKRDSDADIRLLVLHHPLNWFSQRIYRSFRIFVRQIANIIVSGHEHVGNVGLISEAESSESAFVEGCVLQDDDQIESSFNVLVIDPTKSQFLSIQYGWLGDHYASREEGSWAEYRNLPSKEKNLFPISKDFQGLLDDPGAFLIQPGRENITLSDLYVYPDLRQVSDGTRARRSILSSSRLLSPDFSADGVLIRGDEKAGSSSLLYQLYRHFHDRGFVPLYLNGKELKRGGDADIEAVIRHAVNSQYGNERQTAFEQLSTTKKILLLDDFEDSHTRSPTVQANILKSLRKRFGHLVVTVGELFEFREVLGKDSTLEVKALNQYRLQPFGYARRLQLIERWYSIGLDGQQDEATFVARCDQAQRLMDTVMTKSLIPSRPLYLLTLLQSMDAGRSGDFRDSALGYYYQYLLLEAFNKSGVKPEKLTEVFHYSACLAWEFSHTNRIGISAVELQDFNERFSKQWHRVDFAPRLELLVKSRVLCETGGEYSFRYPYIYYYLKGKYLSENLPDLDVRAYISHCCQHLYVRDHANTVLFLAHHTNDQFVLNSIAGSFRGLFKAQRPLTFKDDTGSICKLIENAPQLRYTGESSPFEVRKQRSEIQDELDDGKDGLLEKEETTDELSLLAQITMLFKTTEILGQVLKNQYAKIERPQKLLMLEDLFNGPLRALSDFFSFCSKNVDSLAAEIEAAIQRKGGVTDPEEQKNIARKVVAGLVEIMTFAFVTKAAQAANSDSLAEDIRDVVKRNGTLAFKLIELCIHLDSPKDIPRQKLKSLYKEIGSDLVASRLVQHMVINRLYMFKTREKDLQWLASELDLNLGLQHSIAYTQRKARLIK